MSHRCLTSGAILALLGSDRHYPESFPVVMYRLGTCQDCWKAIETLQGQTLDLPEGLISPFKSLFVTLITQKGITAAHQKALARVRESEFALYTLLLEEGAAYLPYADLRPGQYTLLYIDVLLERYPESPERSDLKARAATIAALFWGAYGFKPRASKFLSHAKRYRRYGTGDPELHATVLGAEAELTTSPEVARTNMLQALDLVKGWPERRVELLFSFGSNLILHDQPGDAWERLIEAEDIAERHSPHLLTAIRSQLLVLESNRGRQASDPAERLLNLCLSHHHVRGVRMPLLDVLAPPEGVVSGRAGGFARLCLALAAGEEVSKIGFAQAGQAVRASTAGLHFLEAFYTRVQGLLERFPDGQLSREMLTPLLAHLQRLEAA